MRISDWSSDVCSSDLSTRGLTLTDAGRDYLAACKRILEDVSEAERAAAGEFSEPRGELVITAPLVLGRMHVLPVIVEFLAAYPEIKVRLIQGDRIAHLLDEHIDLAVRSEEHTSELPSLMRISYDVFCLKK